LRLPIPPPPRNSNGYFTIIHDFYCGSLKKWWCFGGGVGRYEVG